MSTAVTIDTGMYIFCACADAHMHCCLSINWVDQGVVYPFNFDLIRYPACLWIEPIIEVLLYSIMFIVERVNLSTKSKP